MAALLEDPDDCSAGINETNSCAMQNDAVNFAKVKEKGLYVTIEAERGHGYRGDSALDDIKITNMPCSTWAEWSNWGSCSKSCGGGIQTRSRQCFLNNKLKCDGKFKEEQTCSMTRRRSKDRHAPDRSLSALKAICNLATLCKPVRHPRHM